MDIIYANTTIKRKLIIIIMGVTLAVLLIENSVQFISSYYTTRAEKVSQVEIAADLVGKNVSSALDFLDEETAEQNLKSLILQESIFRTCVYDAHGLLFSSYINTNTTGRFHHNFAHECPRSFDAVGKADSYNDIHVVRPVLMNGKRMGWVFIDYDLTKMHASFLKEQLYALLIMLCAIVLAYIFTRRMQRVITNPITHLSRVASKLSEQQDFSIRAQKETEDELGSLVDAFNHMLDNIEKRDKELVKARKEADKANEMKGQFLATMSHEIRTPMNGILGTLQLLKQRQLDTETSQLVDIALTSSELLMRILNDILDFSKLEASKVIIDEHPFSLSDLVSEVVNNVQGAVANKGLSLTVNFNASASEKRIGDEVRIKQVLGNVVSNAIKFTEKGTIILTVNTSPSTTRFIVQDSGIGMTPEQISSLCDRFSQADLSTTRHYGGTGLGMAIVSELLTLMNGTLKVASEINTGTTITIELPLKKAYSTILTTNKSYEVSVPDFTGRTLLIAEDNDINRLVVEELLKPTNATLVIVNDGQQLLQYCRDSYADLIITDINMPVMGGEETLKKLQDTGFARPVIALTANAVKQQVEHYLAMGFHDVLSKPVFAETLYFVIDKHLEN